MSKLIDIVRLYFSEALDRKKIINGLLVVIVFGIPFFFTLFYILNTSSNIIFADEFKMIPLMEKFNSGSLTFGDLWNYDAGHRQVLVKLIFIIFANITSFNVQVLMCFSLLIILSTTILIYLYYRRSIHIQNQYLQIFAFLPVVLLMFSIMQWENLLMGQQFNAFLSVLLLVINILLMKKSLGRQSIDIYLFLAILASIVAILISGIGVVNWIILIVQILLAGLNRKNLRILMIYSASAIIILAAYFYGITTASQSDYFFTHLDQAIIYGTVAIGSSILGTFSDTAILTVSFTYGVALLILYMFVIYTYLRSDADTQRNTTIFILLILFSLACAAEVTFARLHFGIGQATSSRYTTLSMTGAIGAYLFCLFHLVKHFNYFPYARRFIAAFSIILVLIITGYSLSTYEESRVAPYRKANFENLRKIALSDLDKVSDEQLGGMGFNAWDAKLVRDGLLFLKEKELNVYHK